MTIILPFRRVIVESPFKATETHSIEQHKCYLSHCLTDCLRRMESPYASHWGLPDLLDDDDPLERAMGIRAGWAWGDLAEAVIVYGDLGITEGMHESINRYNKMGKPIERRTLDIRLVRSILEM